MNKRPEPELDLRKAFSPTPEACYGALMNAARSVKEEPSVRKISFRALVIAAAIIIATMAIALAAEQLGLINLFGNDYGLPEAAQTVLKSTEQKDYAVGPLTITLRETLADGRLVYVTAQASSAGGANALISPASGDLSAYIPKTEAARLNLPGETSFLEAASQAKMPLYVADAYFEIDPALWEGEEMRAEVFGTDGSVLLVDMLQTDPQKVAETLTGTLTLHVREIDPASAAFVPDRDWRVEEEISIPVGGVTAERIYLPEGTALLGGYTLKSVKAEQTDAGIYLSASLEAAADTPREDVYSLYDWSFLDEKGNAFPAGINMSGSLNEEGWPAVTLHMMIGADALPGAMRLTDASAEDAIALK